MRVLYKHWQNILIGTICLIIIIGAYFHTEFFDYLDGDCKTTWENYKVEFISGFILSIFPILIGIYYGKKLKEYEFYNNAEGLLNTLRRLRENKLMEPLIVRQVVKSVANNFGNEALKKHLAGKAFNKYEGEKHKTTDKCRICNLKAEVENKRCKYCKMNCYAWDLSAAKTEEKEIAEITALGKKINIKNES